MYYDGPAIEYIGAVHSHLVELDKRYPFNGNPDKELNQTDFHIGKVEIFRGRDLVGHIEFDDFNWVFTPTEEDE